MNELFFLPSLVFAVGGLQAWFLTVSLDSYPAAAFCAARGPACGDTPAQKRRFLTTFAASVFSQAGVVAPPDSLTGENSYV